MKSYEAIGVVEAQHFTTALELVDEMCKTSHVQLLGAEKYLGGRLVSLIVAGSIANVTAAVEAAREVCARKPSNPLKMSLVIPKPHVEIMKFIVPTREAEEAESVKVPEALIQETVARDAVEQTVRGPEPKAQRTKVHEPKAQETVTQEVAVQQKEAQQKVEPEDATEGTKTSSPRKNTKKRK